MKTVFNLLRWHYLNALPRLFTIFGNFLLFLSHFFSFSLLIPSLFAPWKGKAKNSLLFNLYSKSRGFIIRSTVILIGLFLWWATFFIGFLTIITFTFIPFIFLFLFYFSFFLLILSPNFLWFFLLIVVSATAVLTVELTLFHQSATLYDRVLDKKATPGEILRRLLNQKEGRFIRQRLGLKKDSLIKLTQEKEADGFSLSLVTKQPGKNQLGYLLSALYSWHAWQSFCSQEHLNKQDLSSLGEWYEFDVRKHLPFWDKERLLRLPGIGKDWQSLPTPLIDDIGDDLTQKAEFVPNLMGKIKEIEELERILIEKGEHNALLIGQTKTGRRTIVYGLAHLISQRRSLPQLEYKRVIALDSQILPEDKTTAGTLVTKVLKEAQAANNIILVLWEIDRFLKNEEVIKLFIDTIGSADIQLVGLTTPQAYDELIKSNKDLDILFKKIHLLPFTFTETVRTLQTATLQVESILPVNITYQAIVSSVYLAQIVFPDVPFPEKAVDTLFSTILYVREEMPTPVIRADHVRLYVAKKMNLSLEELIRQEAKKAKQQSVENQQVRVETLAI